MQSKWRSRNAAIQKNRSLLEKRRGPEHLNLQVHDRSSVDQSVDQFVARLELSRGNLALAAPQMLLAANFFRRIFPNKPRNRRRTSASAGRRWSLSRPRHRTAGPPAGTDPDPIDVFGGVLDHVEGPSRTNLAGPVFLRLNVARASMALPILGVYRHTVILVALPVASLATSSAETPCTELFITTNATLSLPALDKSALGRPRPCDGNRRRLRRRHGRSAN